MPIRTVKTVRGMLKRHRAPRLWSLLRRKVTFGWTEAGVRRQLREITFCGRKVTVHRKVVASLGRIEDHIRSVERAHHWALWKPEHVECFNWRRIRGGTSLSRHAHAIALDIDPDTNLYHDHYTEHIKTDFPVHVIQAFLDDGWTWGGKWDAPCDTMHFQHC